MIRTTLWLAAIFNVVAAYVLAVPNSPVGALFELPADVPVLYAVLSSFFVLVFGGAYAWLAMQAEIVRPLLWMGVIGKSGAFLIAVVLWWMGLSSGKTALLASGDAVFATIWLVWLLRNRPASG